MKKLFTLIASIALVVSGYSQSADVAVNLTATDAGDFGGSTDFQYAFDTAAVQNTISEYRMMVVKDSKSANFTVDSAVAVTSANYISFSSLTANQSGNLGASATDSDGDAVVINVAYRFFVLSIADGTNATNDSLSASSNAVTLVDPTVSADVAQNLFVADIGNFNGAADMEFGFDTAADQSGITEYRAIIVKASKTFTVDSASIVTAGNYISYTAPLMDNVVDTLAAGAMDSDGDAIVTNVAYNLYVLSIANGSTANNDSLSGASASSVTLMDPMIYSIPFIEDFESVATPDLPMDWTTEGAADSDLFMTGNVNTANGAGFFPVTAHTTFAFSNDDVCDCDKSMDYLTTPMIAVPAGIAFNLKYSIFQDDAYGGASAVLVSNNLGNSWSNVYTHTIVPGWTDVIVDLSAYAGDTIMVRFHYDDQGQWGSGMAVDDILIDETPDFDIALTDITVNEYYLIPEDQAKGGFDFTANVANIGQSTATNVIVSVDVNSQTLSSSPVNINSGSNSDIDAALDYVLPGQGTYNFQLSVTMDDTDEVPGNNVGEQGTIRISEETYARGEGGTTALGTALEQYSDSHFGMLYEIFETDTVSAITVDLIDANPVAEIVLKIFEFEDGTGPTVEIATTDFTVLDFLVPGQPEEVTIPLNSFVPIIPGKYLVTATETNGSEAIGMMIDGDTPFRNGVAWTNITVGLSTDGTWVENENLWNGDFYWPIRLELGHNQFTNVEEKLAADFSVYPNPTEGVVNISNISSYDVVEVIDMTGRVLKTVQNNGKNTVSLNVDDLNTGIYMVRVSNNETSMNQKLTVK